VSRGNFKNIIIVKKIICVLSFMLLIAMLFQSCGTVERASRDPYLQDILKMSIGEPID
jgi:hypothetical protein